MVRKIKEKHMKSTGNQTAEATMQRVFKHTHTDKHYTQIKKQHPALQRENRSYPFPSQGGVSVPLFQLMDWYRCK